MQCQKYCGWKAARGEAIDPSLHLYATSNINALIHCPNNNRIVGWLLRSGRCAISHLKFESARKFYLFIATLYFIDLNPLIAF